MAASQQRQLKSREIYVRSGTNCLGERAQNPAQSLKLLREGEDACRVILKTLDRLVERDARLEGEGSQSHQPGSKAYRVCHDANHFDAR